MTQKEINLQSKGSTFVFTHFPKGIQRKLNDLDLDGFDVDSMHDANQGLDFDSQDNNGNDNDGNNDDATIDHSIDTNDEDSTNDNTLDNNDDNNNTNDNDGNQSADDQGVLTGIQEYQKLIGEEFLDDKGNPIEFEDTMEGLASYNQMVAERNFEKLFNDKLNSNPNFKLAYNHFSQGGTAETFARMLTQKDYSKIKFEDVKEDTNYLKSLIKEDLIAKGFSTAKADDYIEFIEKGKKLESEGSDALKNLSNRQIEERQAEYKRTKDLENEQIRKTNEYWDGIKGQINNGKARDIVIPKKDREALYDYMSKKLEGGNFSQFMVDTAKETSEDRIMIAYLKMKNYNLKDLVNLATATQKVGTLKDKFKGDKPSGLGNSQGVNNPTDITAEMINEMHSGLF